MDLECYINSSLLLEITYSYNSIIETLVLNDIEFQTLMSK